MAIVGSDLRIDLDDLPFASTLRAVDDDEPGDYLAVNRAFLELYGMDEAPRCPASFLGDDARGPDEMDRRVAQHNEPMNYDLRLRGRRMSLQKTPVVRDGCVVGVLTSMTNESWLDEGMLDATQLGQIADGSAEAISLIEIDGDTDTTLSQNRASQGFDRFLRTSGIEGMVADQAREELRAFARRAGTMRVPLTHDLIVGERHFRVRSEAVNNVEAPTLLIVQTITDISDSIRSEWFEQLVEIAGSGTVSEAIDRAFLLVQRLLGFDRSAFVRFDGHMIDVLASTVEIRSEQRLHADSELVELLSSAALVPLSSEVSNGGLMSTLDIADGVGVQLTPSGSPWGSLIMGHSRFRAKSVSPMAISMLETLSSTLAILIERDTARRNLLESNRRLETYAHVAAHDLRSPLRRIRSFAQILHARLGVAEIDREQVLDFSERIAEGADRLDVLVQSMLDHANVSALARESVESSDLRAMAHEICEGVQQMSDGLAPEFVIGDLPTVRLPGDAAERVLRNLIDNALKYRDPERPPVIELWSESSAEGVRMHIADNGLGIAPDKVSEVFGLFQQVDGGAGGAGVGLAVVQQLLASRGAKIWVESEVGCGATFVIEFPAAMVRTRAADELV